MIYECVVMIVAILDCNHPVSAKQCPNEKILCLVKQKQFGHCVTSETKLKNGAKIAIGTNLLCKLIFVFV